MKSNKTRAALFLLILIGLITVVRAAGLTDYFDQQRLQDAIGRWGIWGPLVYILIFSVAPALFLPGFPIAMAGGLAFGPIWGTVYASVGSSLGAGVAFLIARYFMRDIVVERLGERWKKIDEGVTRRGWAYVAITRLIPLFPFNFLNYAFGLTKIGFGTFFFATTLFKLPGVAAYVVFSSSFLDLIQGKISFVFLIGLVLFLLVSLTPFLYRKWRGAKASLPTGMGMMATTFLLAQI
ncbi:VTT domain-containing protein [Candidatus Manganitrophus noduliformans]|uniref:TVP38/TMEM64 family membrane protein n=1 Tax=Candidatus Manganitrophus noduliformans TaxID=2606439 RepID=A0A7X6DN48_9BACT|nr:TVP38/TMEM64 family protein [Candidatus Manganitrophus noduliformans]NKE70250.1 TVP38/TMEM64 family protein [Candidatus Manganitrophus noduliformans]